LKSSLLRKIGPLLPLILDIPLRGIDRYGRWEVDRTEWGIHWRSKLLGMIKWPWFRLYVHVESVDAAITKIRAAGGTIVTPNTPIPGMGAYARVSDTEGNVIGLFQGQ
jgi:hypothetical protein